MRDAVLSYIITVIWSDNLQDLCKGNNNNFFNDESGFLFDSAIVAIDYAETRLILS
jgi:hypothetical protein